MSGQSVSNLIPISTVTLLSDTTPGIDIFAMAADDSLPILFCSHSESIDANKLQEIVSNGVYKLYVESTNFQDYQTYLRDHLYHVLDDTNLSIASRTTVLGEVVRDVLQTAFRLGNVDSTVQACRALGAGIVKIIGEERVLVSRLFDVLHHDYATFTHSTNVACFAGILSKRMGYSSQEQHDIVIGALLHDLGKLEIDDRILRKASRLDQFEMRAVQRHPLIGYRKLAHREDLSHGQLMMVYQHHEKRDGSGYPVGLVDQEIHPWAKLCAVVDIFEALTSTRPYRSSMKHSLALSILQKAADRELDAELVSVWSELVMQGGLYT